MAVITSSTIDAGGADEVTSLAIKQHQRRFLRVWANDGTPSRNPRGCIVLDDGSIRGIPSLQFRQRNASGLAATDRSVLSELRRDHGYSDDRHRRPSWKELAANGDTQERVHGGNPDQRSLRSVPAGVRRGRSRSQLQHPSVPLHRQDIFHARGIGTIGETDAD